jgi:hypothetical protein
MLGIIDTLTLPTGITPYFTVNTSVNSVDIVNPFLTPDSNAFILEDVRQKKTFARGDNFAIISAGYVLPESFTMATSPSAAHNQALSISFLLRTVSAGSYVLLSNTQLFVPMENFENGLNRYFNVNDYLSEAFTLVARLGIYNDVVNKPQVSMQGVPSALNSTVQRVTVFVKIIHNSLLT